MYLSHFGLTDSPFKITPHTEVFFEGAQRGEILDALVYAVVQGEGLMKVTGEVGTGKTMLCRMLAERLPDTVETIYLAIPSLTRDEMLGAIAEDLGLEANAQERSNGQRGLQAAQLLRALQSKLIELHESGRRVVVLIDEAHAMPLESLEEIRLLSNLETQSSKLLQIVLFGQPELDAHLALKHMRQLKERITQSFRLQPLSEQEVQQYLNFRLRAAGYRGPELFDARCTKLMTRASQGLSRRINIIADKSMLAAFADNTYDIEPSHVRAAIRDGEFQATRKRVITPWVYASLITLGTIFGGILTWVFIHNKQQPAPPTTVQARAIPSVAPAQPVVTAAAARTGLAYTDSPGMNSVAPEGAAASERLAGTPTGIIGNVASNDNLAAASDSASTASPTQPSAGDEANVPAWQSSRDWMHTQPAQHWVIQLMLSNMIDAGERGAFVAQASAMLGENKLHQYPLELSGAKKVGVLYGPFVDRREAQRALTALPMSLRQYQPYMRTVGVVRQEATYN
jgi:type II secretory pathway predicted ATPase ExeA